MIGRAEFIIVNIPPYAYRSLEIIMNNKDNNVYIGRQVAADSELNYSNFHRGITWLIKNKFIKRTKRAHVSVAGQLKKMVMSK